MLLVTNFGVAIGAVLVLWLVSIPLRDVSIIDMFFAIVLLTIAGTSFVLGNGVVLRKQLVLLLVAIWALRITAHLVKRNWGRGEDPRYRFIRRLRHWAGRHMRALACGSSVSSSKPSLMFSSRDFGLIPAKGVRFYRPGCGDIRATQIILANCASGGACS